MAPTHSVFLGTYRMFVTPFRSKDKIPLNRIDDEGHSFLDWAEIWIRQEVLHNQGADGEPQRFRTSEITRKVAPSYTLYGLVEAGEAGISADLVSDSTGQSRTRRLQDDAELVPFYFQIHCPKDTTTAVLVLQRLGVRGAYVFFAKNMVTAFREYFPGYRLHVEPFIAKQVLDKMANAPLREVTIHAPDQKGEDLTRLFDRGYDPATMSVRQVITAHRGKTLPSLKRQFRNLFNAKRRREKLTDVPDEWKDLGDRITFTVEVAGRNRSLSFGVDREIVPYEEVTSRISWARDGNPTLQSVHLLAEELAGDVRQDIQG